jgi:hypothetical protein
MSEGKERPLEDRIADVLGGGAFKSDVAEMRLLRSSGLLDKLIGAAELAELDRILATADDVPRTAAAGIRLFAGLGWSPNRRAPHDAMREAVRAASDGDEDEAERLLVLGYERLLSRPTVIHAIGTLGYPSEEYREVFRARSRLLHRAWEHHRDGHYEASVPIVLAQVEGITYDVVDKPFFSRRDGRAQPVDAQTLAGVDKGLAVARDWFSRSANVTVTAGGGSRHGVLHGRDLGYDTKLISTKAFVLLISVCEWAQPIAGELGRWFEAEAALLHAGSDEVDEEGRRRDRREFRATRDALRRLSNAQMGRHRNQGRYDPELLEVLRDALVRVDRLPPDLGIRLAVGDDGQSWYAWRTTPSGYVFAVGASAPCHVLPDGEPTDWRYEGHEAPTGPPGADPRWGPEPYGQDYPNW